MAYNWTTEWPGIYARHESTCQLRNGGDCTCARVAYRASAKAPDQHSRLLSPEFATALEARDWLHDQRARVTAAMAVAEEGPNVSAVIAEFLAAAERGDEVRAALSYVQSELGSSPLQAVRRRNVQALIDELGSAGLPPERIVQVVLSFRDVFSYAISRDLVDFNPIVQLRLPGGGEIPAEEPLASYVTGGGMSSNGHHPEAQVPLPQPLADEPFADEPTYGPAMHALDDEPDAITAPAPVPAPALVPTAAFTAPTAAFTAPYVPPAGDPEWAPPLGSTIAPPPPAPVQLPTPVPPAPAFAPPSATTMITPIGAETHYGTPTFGAESVATQRTVQSPARDGQDGVFMSEQMFWWITRIVVIVFVLIALVLVAESV
ncbi:MAG TPA: hypothetical protein VH247_01515 [Thermoleophilaceae bacterium]|jgi:hypothetical protein|nr:hypothetical protein [Thermoleophilaceae bacterium]